MKIISIVGRKNTGKTSLSVRIISELTKRGYNVASIKHSHHTMEMDRQNTDTWKHKEAGSKVVTGIGATTFFNIREKMDLNRILFLIRYFGNIDYVVIEGFKSYSYPKIATSPDAADEYTIKQVDSFTMTEDEIRKLTNLIEKRSHDIINTLYKKNCGFTSGESLAKEIREGNITGEDLDNVSAYLSVNDNVVGLNRFVSAYLKENILAIVNTINTEDYGIEKTEKIEIIIDGKTGKNNNKVNKSKIYINQKELEINRFTEEIITNTIKGAVNSLKTEDNIEKINIKISGVENDNLTDAGINLKINNKALAINRFTSEILKQSVYAMINTLKTDEKINEIEIDMDVENDH